jgi:lipopolysaccharide transport system permease protein
VWACEIVFVCGLSLATSALHVYLRDTRYVVESINLILFWLVPIFYSFDVIPLAYRDIYQYNPVAALVLASRHILLEGIAPPISLMSKLALSSALVFGGGLLFFRRLKQGFYDHL